MPLRTSLDRLLPRTARPLCTLQRKSMIKGTETTDFVIRGELILKVKTRTNYNPVVRRNEKFFHTGQITCEKIKNKEERNNEFCVII